MRGIRKPEDVERSSSNDEVAGVKVVLPIPTFWAMVAADAPNMRAVRILAFIFLVPVFERCTGNTTVEVMMLAIFLDERHLVKSQRVTSP